MPHLCGVGGPRKQVCGGCGEDCLYDGIFCDSCATWRHIACERLSVKEVQAFRDLPSDFPFICTACRSDSRGSFSYDESLKRLHKAAKHDYEKLETCVARESLFIRGKFTYTRTKVADVKVDVHAQSLFEKYVRDSKSISTPVKTTTDGNSLFSAVSLAFFAKEKLATELRVRCCIEMVNFASFYQWQKNHETLRLCAPDYFDSCLNCATPGEDSCVWTMSALASVIGVPIKSMYPGVNGQKDRALTTLNTVFCPRDQGQDSPSENIIRILWSNKKAPIATLLPGTWVPDHFVPLVDAPSFQLSPVMGSLPPSRVSGRKRKPTTKLLDSGIRTLGTGTLHLEVSVEDEEDLEDTSETFVPDAEAQKPTRKWKRRKPEVVLDPDWQKKYTHDAVGGQPLGSNFLLVKEIFDAITTTKEPLPSIPRGRKNDVYFIVDNSRNVRHQSRRNHFPDDCGAYHMKTGTTCKSWYLYKDSIISALNKVDGKLCKETKQTTKMVRGKKVKHTKWIPMDPQPDENSIILLNRYYTALQCDPNYRRRISWFSMLPPSVEGGREIMVVEYLNKVQAGVSRTIQKTKKNNSVGGDDSMVAKSSTHVEESGDEMENETRDGAEKGDETMDETRDDGAGKGDETMDETRDDGAEKGGEMMDETRDDGAEKGDERMDERENLSCESKDKANETDKKENEKDETKTK